MVKAREIQWDILHAIDDIQETSSRQIIGDAQIAERLDLGVQEVQDHLDLMAEAGYVKLSKTFGPSYSAWLTPRGRIALREDDHVERETFSATRFSQPVDRLRKSSTPYSTSPQESCPPSEWVASLMREVERIQKIVDHNLQLKLDDAPQVVKRMPATALETAFGGERRLGVSKELLQAVDDYLDCAASVNALVDTYKNMIRSGRGTVQGQIGIMGSSPSSYTIQKIQKVSKQECQECIEGLKQRIEELGRSQQRAEESMPEATGEAPSGFQSSLPERVPTSEHFVTHIDSVTGPVHIGRGDTTHYSQKGHPRAATRSGSKPLAIALFILGIIITIVTNIASDRLPEAWEPYLWLAWPLLGVLVIIAVWLSLKGRGTIDG